MALLLKSGNSADCCCPPMPVPTIPCPPVPSPQPDPDDKYYHEVGAEMVGNQLIIRMEKEKRKHDKRKNGWEPPCDCDVIEIKRPSKSQGPKIVNGGDNNQIVFRMHSKAHLTKKEDPNYKPQAIAYKINKSSIEEGDHCRRVTVYPQLGGPVSQDVYSDHVTEGNQDIYLLRVKKRNDSEADGNKRNMEVELRTPRLPPKPLPPPAPLEDPCAKIKAAEEAARRALEEANKSHMSLKSVVSTKSAKSSKSEKSWRRKCK